MRLEPLMTAAALAFVLTSCGGAGYPELTVSAYSERTVEAHIPLRMDIDCDRGSTEVFSWNGKAVKLEIKRIVRGYESRESLDRRLENLKVDAEEKGDVTELKCRYAGRVGNTEGSINLKIYVPKKTEYISVKQKEGRIAFLDDFNGILDIEAEKLDVDINKISGKLNCTLNRGDVNVSSGILESGSGVKVSSGNIKIKASFEPDGNYDFKTGFGILALCLPGQSGAVFETYGLLESEEFTAGERPSKFRLESKTGKIAITKF